jgi:hypothetical protein
MSDEFRRNLLGPEPTYLPEEYDVTARLEAGDEAVDVAARYPASSLPWAILADEAYAEGRTVESYAFARTGYHRGLDALRRNGWKGAGPVPYSHEPNRGFLRALNALGRAAASIGEIDEAERVAKFLKDSDPEAAKELGS